MKLLFERDKHSMSEVVLLGIFAVGLLFAWLIVAEKTRVTFSESIELGFAGVSVAVPHGEGWQFHDEWQYKGGKNEYFLASMLRLGNQEKIFCQWEYMLAEPAGVPEEKLMETVAKSNGVIIEDGVVDQGDLAFTWVKFTQASRDKEGIIAITRLPSGRYLKIIVLTDSESDSLVPLFEKAIKSVKYRPNELLEQGSEFVGHVKFIGIAALMQNKQGQWVDDLYLVKKDMRHNGGRRVVGFAVERFEDFDDEYSAATIAAKHLHVIEGRAGWTDAGSFECDDSCSEFRWDNRRKFVNGTTMLETSVICDSSGEMLVISGNSQVQFQLSDIAMPEAVMAATVRAFVDHDSEKQLVEVVSQDGHVMPTMMSKVEPGIDEDKSGIKYVVKLDYLSQGRENFKVVYFDADKNIVKIVLRGGHVLILEPTNWPDLIMGFEGKSKLFDEMFPGRAI